jgi:hypothetical protein
VSKNDLKKMYLDMVTIRYVQLFSSKNEMVGGVPSSEEFLLSGVPVVAASG